MPRDRVYVERISKTQSNGTDRFLVTANYADGRNDTLQVYVFNAWRASLCEAALRQNRPCIIEWRDMPGYKKLTNVLAA